MNTKLLICVAAAVSCGSGLKAGTILSAPYIYVYPFSPSVFYSTPGSYSVNGATAAISETPDAAAQVGMTTANVLSTSQAAVSYTHLYEGRHRNPPCDKTGIKPVPETGFYASRG